MTDPKTEAVPANPTKEALHDALIHFLELGAAFEGEGIEFVLLDEPEQSGTDAEALACLSDVVARLNKHLFLQRERQRQLSAKPLHGAVTKLFERFHAAPDEVDLIAELDLLVRGLGFVPDERMLDELVIGRFDMTAGPSKTAAEALAPLFGVKTGRTIFNYISDTGGVDAFRKAWRRWVPLQTCKRYAERVVAAAGRFRRDAEGPAVGDLDGFTPRLTALFDRRAEEQMRESFRGMFEFMFTGDLSELSLKDDEREKLAQFDAMRRKAKQAIRDWLKKNSPAADDGAALEDAVKNEYAALVPLWIDRLLDGMGLGSRA